MYCSMNVTTSAVSSRNFVNAMPTKREENKGSTEEEEEKKKRTNKKRNNKERRRDRKIKRKGTEEKK